MSPNDDAAPALPPIVSAEEWQREREALLVAEKDATRLLDRLAARRRRLPMVAFDATYEFASSSGPRTLLDLFEGRHQLAVYQFMDNGPEHFCPGCTWFTEQVSYLRGLSANGVSWATVSDMPLVQMAGYWEQRGWTVPFASSHGTRFSADCGAGGGFLLSAFLRDEDRVYRTYSTGARGVDRLLFVNSLLDLMPYGRQEDWEDSPAGWPQGQTDA